MLILIGLAAWTGVAVVVGLLAGKGIHRANNNKSTPQMWLESTVHE